MTAQPTALFPAPPQILRPGDLTWTWCSKHLVRTDHLWTGHKLICLECHPEARPK